MRLLLRMLLAALIAGGGAGLLASGLQTFKQWPLIEAAEQYETAAPGAAEAEPPLDRAILSLVANLLAGTGYALLLLAAYGLRHEAAPRGILWGLGGYGAFVLAPALVLPPELPGAVAPDLALRQVWWIGTAAATAGGLLTIAYGKRVWQKAGGLALLLLPHLWRLPLPDGQGSAPPELAAEFAVASLAVNLVFWLALGVFSALAFQRLVWRAHAPA